MVKRSRVKAKVEAAKEALGYGVCNDEYPAKYELYKSVYLCSAECGGVGCHVGVVVCINKRNGKVKVYVNGWDLKGLEKMEDKAETEEDAMCFGCMKGYAEWLENYIYENAYRFM